jgi:hypothetical protein
MVEEIVLAVPPASRAYGAGVVQALMPYSSLEMPESSRLSYLGEDGVIRVFDVPSGKHVHR